MIVSVWQDVSMEQFSVEAEPPAVRTVNDVEMLKAMADPTRLAILSALMKSGGDLPVMSVKELAAELHEPQTKLYRHVKQLEAAGLIRVAGTRLVSGIVEQRYQACQRDLTLARGFLYEHADESEQVVQAVLDRYFDGFRAAFRADRLPENEVLAEESYRKPVLFYSDLKLSPAQAAEIVSKLKEVMDSQKRDGTEDPDGVRLNLLIGCYVPVEEAGG
jgi:DNA-binding transcriptional ArsR family regulator